MKKITAGIFLYCLSISSLQAQTNSNTVDAPSEAHRFLAGYEGTWTEEVSTFPVDGSDVEKVTLTAVINMIMGGRFLQCSETGEMGGQAFEALMTLGYDQAAGQFTLVQISTLDAATLVADGRWKEAGKSIVLNGNKPASVVITFTDKDNFLIENFERGGKEEVKTMEYHFSRQ